MKLENFLQEKYNYDPDVKDNMQTYITQWDSWYQGNVKSFHNYFIYNGNRKIKQKRFTMNMAKEISEDWSDILWSEKCEISLKDEESQKKFNEIANNLNLMSVINQTLEKSGALGTAATVLSVYDIIESDDGIILDTTDAKLRIDTVNVDNIYPITWNNKEITECAFSSTEYIDGNKYQVLSVHVIGDNGNYIIHNHLFKNSNGNLVEIQTDDTLTNFDTKSNIKWFSIFKPLLTNNLFVDSPLGIPHYANAIDNLKAVDLSFDALNNEIKDGRKRLFVRADMMNYDNGVEKLTFDPNDTTVYQLPKDATKDDLIQSDSDKLRTAEQIETLNTQLNILGSKVGFGENHYHFDGTNLSTATAVVSSNSKLFRRKKKLEIGYENAIRCLVEGICYIYNNILQDSMNYDDITIKFDDSIIEDKEAESQRAMRELAAGVLSKEEYREKIFGETPEIAKEKVAEIKANSPTMTDLLGE